MPTTNLSAFVDDIVHEPTQTEGSGVALTVSDIYEITTPGRVDFDGGELESADIESHASAKRNPDDDYAWWTLDAGQYLIEYNETLSPPEDVSLVIQTRDELLTRGAFHPTLHTQELGRIPLSVDGAGLTLKENARVSTNLPR
jgi:deoxycytidine triphosphate deaminase